MPVISFENVRKVYPLPAGDVVALAGIDIAIEKGEFVLVMGPSGSGKSTLLNIMGSLDVPTSGEVTIAGKRIGGMDDDELTLMRRQPHPAPLGRRERRVPAHSERPAERVP